MKNFFKIHAKTIKINFPKYNRSLAKKSIFSSFIFLLLINCLLSNNASAVSIDVLNGVIDEEKDTTQLRGYKQSYIIFSSNGGNDDNGNMNVEPDIKIQISFKKQLSAPKRISDRFSEGVTNSIGKLFFGYTQKLFWDIARDSLPFRESNYNPSLFYENSFGDIDDERDFRRFPNSYGYEHESNGQNGIISRSWDRIFIEQHIDWGRKTKAKGFRKQNHFAHELEIKGWAVVNKSGNNDRVEHFLGNTEISYAWTGNINFLNDIRFKLTFRKRSGRIDLFLKELPLLKIGRKGQYWWLLQYFNGFGDSLERYDQHEHVVRFGVAFFTR